MTNGDGSILEIMESIQRSNAEDRVKKKPKSKPTAFTVEKPITKVEGEAGFEMTGLGAPTQLVGAGTLESAMSPEEILVRREGKKTKKGA